MMIHPLEALGYYLILYSPPFVAPMHAASFAAYMAVMGACGVLDHAGIRVSVPWLYDAGDHDRHHELFDVNFGFPTMVLDHLCGTYRGEAAAAAGVEGMQQVQPQPQPLGGADAGRRKAAAVAAPHLGAAASAVAVAAAASKPQRARRRLSTHAAAAAAAAAL